MFIAVSEIAFVKEVDLLQTFASAKHQCPMGRVDDLRDPRGLRRHVLGHNSAHPGKSSDERIWILRTGNADPRIGLRHFKQ